VSVEAFGHINPNQTVETSQKYDQPPDTSDATTLPQQEIRDDRHREVSYLSSAAILAHERALLSDMQAEAASLAEEIRQADIALARIKIDFLYIEEQISDLGRAGVPQMTMKRNLEETYRAAAANKTSLVLLHKAKLEEINALHAHQNRREWSMSDDY
jgi:hypothetical protein